MTLEQIEVRMSQISEELKSETADIDALEIEVNDLQEKRSALVEQIEKRNKLLNSIATDEVETRQIINPIAEERKVMENKDIFSTVEYRQAFMNYALKGEAIPTEYRAAGVTKTTDVGAVIPSTVLNKIIEKIEATGMILPLVTRTSVKGGVSIPTSSVKPVATWVAEGAGSEKQKKTTGSITFAYHKLRCAVAVTLETDLMALSAFEAALISNVVEAMVKSLEQAIISGTGEGQPKGILTETVAEGQEITKAVSYQTLCELEAALPFEYENGAVYVMSKKSFMEYVAMVDANGQPIARVNYGIGGRPERTLLGRNVVICNYLPSEVHTFLFNFKDYVLNTNYQIGLKKYEDNETDDIVTKAIMIADGKVVDVNSLVVLKKA